jgi:hypothetical protein
MDRVVTQHASQKTGWTRSEIRRGTVVAAALLVGLAACNDDPFAYNWTNEASPDTVLLYSLARPEPNLVSGFSFAPYGAGRGAVLIEEPNATGTWDVALDTQGPGLVLMPPGALGVTGRAAIAPVGAVSFDALDKAPSGSDTIRFVVNDPVPVSMGNVYVVRTNRLAGSFGSSCVYYAKVEPVMIDVAGETLTFRYVANPVCNSLDLVPPN